ncbi:MAG: hypothetical protein AAF997_06645 [Myxococcota bacterium]
MKLVVAFGKVLALAGWLWGLGSLVAPASVPAPEAGRMLFFGLLAVHVAEAFIFAKNLVAEAGGTVAHHASQLLVFGYFHVLGVRYG